MKIMWNSRNTILIGMALALSACAANEAKEQLTMGMIAGLQSSGQIQAFNQLNSDVIARHPGSEVEHAALDEEAGRYLYQASLTDPNKMQWYVEVDAKTGETVTDRQE